MINVSDGAKKSLEFLADLQHNEIVIKKTGYNSYADYTYATLDDILTAIQPYLAKHNCIVVWSEVEHSNEVEHVNEKTYYAYTDSTLSCRILCVTGVNDYISCLSHGYGINKNSDKTCKATTIGKRYALINLLGIKSVNDEDTDNPKFDVAAQKSEPVSGAAANFKNRRNRKSSGMTPANPNQIV